MRVGAFEGPNALTGAGRVIVEYAPGSGELFGYCGL